MCHFGYDIQVVDGRKVLVPNQDADAVRRIFRMIASRARCWRSRGPWRARSGRNSRCARSCAIPLTRRIVQQARQVTYAQCEPIVPAADWLTANQTLAARGRKPGRGGGRKNKAFLWPVCGRCGGRFYRHGPSLYRCYGVGPSEQPAPSGRGAGVTISLEDLDRQVWQAFADADDAEVIETVVPGKDWAEEIAATTLAIRDLDPAADDYDERHSALMAELRDLRVRPVEPERRTATATGRTEGEAFQLMTRDEQRDFIKLWTLTVWPKGREPRWSLDRS